MRNFVRKNSNHIGILTSVYLTTLTLNYFYKKQIDELNDIHIEENVDSHMKGFRSGWSQAESHFNRHPHTSCTTCIQNRYKN